MTDHFDPKLDASILPLVDEHEEERITASGRKVRHKGVYLLPNLITTTALFAGFFAIVSGMNNDFVSAGMAIIVAQLIDGLDGRVARLTNTTSAFGVQYDSLSDMVSFGLAPALVIYNWGLQPLGKYGLVAAFIYTACAALRLARFNTQVETVDKRYFVGLASPPAAAILAATVWLWHDMPPNYSGSVILACITVVIGLAMVSNLRYTSFKGLNLRGRVPFAVMLLCLLFLVLLPIIADYPLVLLLLACTYFFSGPVMWVIGMRKPMPAN